jgi:hypothetical protein
MNIQNKLDGSEEEISEQWVEDFPAAPVKLLAILNCFFVFQCLSFFDAVIQHHEWSTEFWMSLECKDTLPDHVAFHFRRWGESAQNCTFWELDDLVAVVLADGERLSPTSFKRLGEILGQFNGFSTDDHWTITSLDLASQGGSNNLVSEADADHLDLEVVSFSDHLLQGILPGFLGFIVSCGSASGEHQALQAWEVLSAWKFALWSVVDLPDGARSAHHGNVGCRIEDILGFSLRDHDSIERGTIFNFGGLFGEGDLDDRGEWVAGGDSSPVGFEDWGLDVGEFLELTKIEDVQH